MRGLSLRFAHGRTRAESTEALKLLREALPMYEAVPAENGALVDAHSSLLFTNGLYALAAVLSLTALGYYALPVIPTGVTTVVSYLHHANIRPRRRRAIADEVCATASGVLVGGGALTALCTASMGAAGNPRAAVVAANAGASPGLALASYRKANRQAELAARGGGHSCTPDPVVGLDPFAFRDGAAPLREGALRDLLYALHHAQWHLFSGSAMLLGLLAIQLVR